MAQILDLKAMIPSQKDIVGEMERSLPSGSGLDLNGDLDLMGIPEAYLSVGILILVCIVLVMLLTKSIAKFAYIPLGGGLMLWMAKFVCIAMGYGDLGFWSTLWNVFVWEGEDFRMRIAVYVGMGLGGIAVGWVGVFIEALGQAVLGSALGGPLGELLSSCFHIESDMLRLVSIAGISGAVGAASFLYEDTIYIVATSVLGSVLLMCGSDTFLGFGFTPLIKSLSSSYQVPDTDYKTWLMFGTMCFIAIVSIVFQSRVYKE